MKKTFEVPLLKKKEEELTFHLSLLFSQTSNSNIEDNMSVADDPMHTSLDDGALFDQLDVLETILQFAIVSCALTLIVALLLIFSSLLTGSVHSKYTEDGQHIDIGLENLRHLLHLILGDDITFGLKFQDHQVSFGIDFTFLGSKIKLNEHLLLHFCQIILVALHGPIIYYAIVYLLDQVEHIPLLPKNKIPPYI